MLKHPYIPIFARKPLRPLWSVDVVAWGLYKYKSIRTPPLRAGARAGTGCILFKVLGGVVDLPVGSVPLWSRGTGDRGGAGRDGLERLVIDS